jgi:glutamate--cysteine ligase
MCASVHPAAGDHRPTTLELPEGQARARTAETHRQWWASPRSGRFRPCAVLLNNDLSAGVPNCLKGLHEQFRSFRRCMPAGPRGASRTISRPTRGGGVFRRAHRHRSVAHQPDFGVCGEINFQERTAKSAWPQRRRCCSPVSRKYGVRHRAKPFVIVKADAGTYGMGIMTVRDASEVLSLNRKQRNKMAVVKEGMEVSEVIIQEGVPTFETVDDGTAEPVVYMIDRYVVGGFYRVNTGPRHRREPERAGHALQAAGLRYRLHAARCGTGAGCAAQSFLCLRRHCASGTRCSRAGT